jgi:hypothetical protein
MAYMVARNRRLSVELKHIDIIKTGRVYKFLPVVDVLEVPNSLHFLLATGEYDTIISFIILKTNRLRNDGGSFTLFIIKKYCGSLFVWSGVDKICFEWVEGWLGERTFVR